MLQEVLWYKIIVDNYSVKGEVHLTFGLQCHLLELCRHDTYLHITVQIQDRCWRHLCVWNWESKHFSIWSGVTVCGGENAHQHFPAGDKDYKDLSFPSRCCCWEWSQKWEIPAELSVAVSEELKRICFNLYFLLVIWFWAFCNLAQSVGLG